MDALEVSKMLADVPGPGLDPRRGTYLYEYALAVRATRILEVGTGRGKSTAYLAGAVAKMGDDGVVVSIDSTLNTWADPTAREVLERSGMSGRVRLVKQNSCATWDLKRLLDGNEAFDLIFVDGPKSLAPVIAVLTLARSLLTLGGTIIADDRSWRYADYVTGDAHFGVEVRHFSDHEWRTPHIQAALDIVFRDGTFDYIDAPDERLAVFRQRV